ncbi:MAG: nucleotidyltransferase domain-containing protein [Candidatus Aenigmarchaeota archaeon]|nr:nucleotidyltransferase domain-containing protein [Candidatus Aenigmarchaeota archaeon]
MDKKKDIDRLREFKKNLSKIVPIYKMIWFGSRVSGKSYRWSDFDLIIVSSKFRNEKFRYRPLGFRKYWNLNYPVDFLCYTPEEYEKLRKEISIVKEAEKNGIEIK